MLKHIEVASRDNALSVTTTPAGRSGTRSFLVPALLFAFVASRLPTLLAHELHNDETIFMKLTGLMAHDWSAYRFLTIDGRISYHAPLQLWIGTLALRVLHEPLALRWVALLFAGLGFLALVSLARRAGGAAAALATGILLVLSPYGAYFDALYLGEPFVYGLGAAYLFCLHAAVTRDPPSGPAPALLAAAAVIGALALLAKESAACFLAAGLPLALIAVRRGDPPGWDSRIATIALATAATAVALAYLAIPTHYYPVAADSGRLQMAIYSPRDLSALPVGDWIRNAIFELRTLVVDLNALPLVLPAAFVWYARGAGVARREAGGLLAAWAVASLPLVLLLRTTYVRHFGMSGGVFLTGAGVLLAEAWRRDGWARAAAATALAIALGTSLWTYWRPLLREGYTPIAIRETTESWAAGAGIFAMLGTLERLPPGILLLDPAYGLPRTAVEAFLGRFPQLDLRTITPKLLDEMGVWHEDDPDAGLKAAGLIAEAHLSGREVYLLFESGRPRPWSATLLANHQWCGRREVLPKRWEGREQGMSQRVLCTARPREVQN